MEDPSKLLQVLQEHFELTQSVTCERHLFNKCEQEPTETIDQYIPRLFTMAAFKYRWHFERRIDQRHIGLRETDMKSY